MTDEMDDLQGTWRIVSLEVEGSQMEEVYFTGSKVMVAQGGFTTVSMGAAYGGMLAIDATSDPHKIDMIFTYGPHAGMLTLGIYRFEGDTWVLCLALAGRERPEAFATQPGSGHALERLEREPEPKAEAEPAPAPKPAPQPPPKPAPQPPPKKQ
jgi:uncharacterized protein (TIGR03067 family)